MPDFLTRQLEQLLVGVLTKKNRKLKFENGSMFFTNPDLDEGTSEVVRQVMDEVGSAQLLADGAWDIPVVDTKGDEERYKVYMVAASFSLSYQQERGIKKARKGSNKLQYDPFRKRIQVATKAIAERHNKIAAYGSSNVGITGFVNDPGVSLDDNTFDFFDGATTSQQIIDFIIDSIEAHYTSTANNSTVMPNRIAVSQQIGFRLMGKTTGVNGDKPLGKYIEEALKIYDIDAKFVMCPELNSPNLEANVVHASGTNKDRLVFYNNDKENVERHIELPGLAPKEWQQKDGGRTVFPVFSFTTPTIINYPQTVRYVDVPKKA